MEICNSGVTLVSWMSIRLATDQTSGQLPLHETFEKANPYLIANSDVAEVQAYWTHNYIEERNIVDLAKTN